MRRLAVAALVLALHGPVLASRQQTRPLQADAIVRLLSDLEGALVSGRYQDFAAISAPGAPSEASWRFLSTSGGSAATAAVVRERARRPGPDATDVLAEVFVSHGRYARIATWQITARPKPGVPDRAELVSLAEVAAVDGLLKLSLSPQAYSIHNLHFQAPDLSLRMSSGTAFVAESDGGVTGIVLRGDGQVHFSPPADAEQAQVRLFSGRPALTADVDQVFIRLNPSEFAARLSDQSLVPIATVDARERARADDIFEERSTKTYSLDLRDLAADRWSLEPTIGSLVVDFRTRRFGWLTYARSPSDPEDISLFDRARGRNISAYASPEKLARRGAFYSEDSDQSYDVEHIDLDLRFDPARAWIAGRGTLRLRIKYAAAATLMLKLAEPLQITSVTSPTLGLLLTLRIVGQNNFLVSLPTALSAGELVTLTVQYAGRLEPQGLEREAIAVQGQEARSEIQLRPEARYMYSNRLYWYPQGQVSDFATATMRLSVPPQYQLVASGSVKSSAMTPIEDDLSPRPEGDLQRTVEYSVTRPARYLACIISRFVPIGRTRVAVPAVAGALASDEPASVAVEVVSTPRQAPRNRQTTARVADILKTYAERLGDAPYPDFTLAALDDNLPGGHSPAYFAILHQPLPTTPFAWSDDPVAFEGFPNFFLAHEIAHQWWGQAIGWKNYHEQWLSEGFAQYFALLYAEKDRGPALTKSLQQQMRDSVRDKWNKGPISLGYRLGHLESDGRIFRAILYNKSALVLSMLRQIMGDDAFFRAIRRFYHEYQFSKAGTDDLRVILEAESSRDFKRFMDQWVRGTALPRIRVTSRYTPGADAATVKVEQIGEPFDVPISLAVIYDDGRVESQPVVLSKSEEEFTVPVKGQVRRIEGRDLVLGDFVK